MPLSAAAAIGIGALLDRLFAEPPRSIHPVAWFGKLVAEVDREWQHPEAAGAVAAVVLPSIAAAVAGGFVAATAAVAEQASPLDPILAPIAAGVVLFSTTSLRMLLEEARTVIRLTDADPASARERLRSLAGRDASRLSPAEIRSAAVESAAENLADGLVAPLAAFALLAPIGLPLAAAGAAWVKGVNTLDSMLGYRSKPAGRASARLDDAVMWLPARVSAGLLAVAAADPGAAVRARADARIPASPNSGWPMATLAHALDARLTKPDHYALNGDASLPARSQAERGVAIVTRAGWLAVGSAGVIAWL